MLGAMGATAELEERAKPVNGKLIGGAPPHASWTTPKRLGPAKSHLLPL